MQKDFLLEWPRLWSFKKHSKHNKGIHGKFLNTFLENEIWYPLQWLFNKVKSNLKLTLHLHSLVQNHFDLTSNAIFWNPKVLLWSNSYDLPVVNYVIFIALLGVACSWNSKNLPTLMFAYMEVATFVCFIFLSFPFFHAAFSWLTGK